MKLSVTHILQEHNNSGTGHEECRDDAYPGARGSRLNLTVVVLVEVGVPGHKDQSPFIAS